MTTTITYEEFLKELLALGASARGAEDWFDLATIGITEKDTAKSLAKFFYEDELGNQELCSSSVSKSEITKDKRHDDDKH